MCNCPLRDTPGLCCSLISAQSKLVADKVIIMTIRCGSIPRWPQESYSVMLAARTGSHPQGANRTEEGGLRCLLANINRMEVPLYRERNPGPQETGEITGLSSAPRTCFDCNVLCFLLVMSPPPPAPAPAAPPKLLHPWIPPVPIKLNCTETMLCCGVGSKQHCGCSPPEIQSPYSTSTTTHLPHKHARARCTHFIIGALSPQLAHIHTPLTRQRPNLMI